LHGLQLASQTTRVLLVLLVLLVRLLVLVLLIIPRLLLRCELGLLVGGEARRGTLEQDLAKRDLVHRAF
jgi:hypothetical protein